MEESIFFDRIRGLFAVIDKSIYNLITIFYDTITKLTDVTILSAGEINEFSNRIYGLVALFMIFRISFSLINYIVNPDLIVDKTKGGSAIIKNILITFVLIITVPFAFDLLYRAQSAILSDGLIQKYILGENNYDKRGYTFKMDDSCSNSTTVDNAGDYLGLVAFKSFFQLETDSKKGDFPNNYEEKYCTATGDSLTPSVHNVLVSDIYNAPKGISFKRYYTVNYVFFISTIVGAVLALLMLSFCFDIAVRTIKLQFLELIAPVPIISYIDPSQSKNGMFSKWTKEVLNTWLSLFMRLGAFYFAIYAIGLIMDVPMEDNSLWIRLLIVIGALIFAKQLPKVLENTLGIKGSGSFNLNPLKKLDNEALGFKSARTFANKASIATGAVGLTVAGNMYNRYKRKEELEKKDNELSEIFKNRLNDKLIELRNLKTSGAISASEWRSRALEAQRINAAELNSEKKKLGNFSDKHPHLSAMTAIARSATKGFESGAKSLTDAFQNMTAAAANAADLREQYDKRTLSTRAQDWLTDISGVKNESGTTSQVKQEIKGVTEELKDIGNHIETLNHAIAGVMQQTPDAINYADGKMNVNQNSGLSDIQKDQLQYAIDQYNLLRTTEKEKNKELNKLNDYLKKDKK